MVSLKRSIAALIVCFKPHVFLTLCILLVIAHSIYIAIQKGASTSWKIGRNYDLTLTMTTLILIVALIWAAFFIFIVRFELRTELESLLTLFQCSKRGLRFLGVIVFHFGFLTLVALIVASAVERSIPSANLYHDVDAVARNMSPNLIDDGDAGVEGKWSLELGIGIGNDDDDDNNQVASRDSWDMKYRLSKKREQSTGYNHWKGFNRVELQDSRKAGENLDKSSSTKAYRDHLLTVYKIWLTGIVYAFLYLITENLIMFYADLSLVEFVHCLFLSTVARFTGIDLSDYPAGEMLSNPLIRQRLR